jgi:hypothetical protein
MPDPLAAWDVDEAAFPAGGSPAERLRFALRYAVLAPSGHNTQPWLFRVRERTVELHADRARALPVVDPEDRALTISCGAALFFLLTALRHFGEAPRAELLPDAADPDLLARIDLAGGRAATDEDHALFRAIPERRTVRARFEDRPLPAELLAALRAAARDEGAWLHVAEDEAGRAVLAELIAQADYFQMHDRSFRRELAAWVHPNRSASLDGMPGYALGFGDLASYFGPLVIRTFDLGGGQAAKDRDLAAHSPALVVVETEGDGAADWLRAGMALGRVLLRARTEGVFASYLNQPIEAVGLRSRVSGAIERSGYPQLLSRLGYHDGDVKPTPRRPVEAVLLPD